MDIKWLRSKCVVPPCCLCLYFCFRLNIMILCLHVDAEYVLCTSICHHGYCWQSTTRSIYSKALEESFFCLSLLAVWNWTVMGQLWLRLPLRNIWKHRFMIPHGPLILMKIFTTRLVYIPRCNRSISLDRRLTMVCCYGAPEGSNCILWRREKGHNLAISFWSADPLLQSLLEFPTMSVLIWDIKFRGKSADYTESSLSAGAGSADAYVHETINQLKLPIMQKRPHSYDAMSFCPIRTAETWMKRVIAHVNVL